MVRSFLTRFVDSTARTVVLVPCLLICLACATSGEKFQLASLPRQGQAHVYVYYAIVGPWIPTWEIISLDYEEVGTLRAPVVSFFKDTTGCQYLLLSVSPGDHRIQARTNNFFALGLIPKNSQEIAVTAEADRVYFVRLRLVAHVHSEWTVLTLDAFGNPQPSVLQSFTDWVKLFSFSRFTADDPPLDITECELINSSPE